MGNLGPKSSGSTDPRPFQLGEVEGTKSGSLVKNSKTWLVDTGASVSAITKDNGDDFDLTPNGATASATSGGTGLIMKTGLTMVFTVKDTTGTDKDVRCSLAVGVKPDNNGNEILGMDQVAHVKAKIQWDPVLKDGDIYE
jgi:hypothetical protein